MIAGKRGVSMTESEARGFIQGKLDCMNKCNVFEREHSYNTELCDNCEYCYSQGNFGNQKEAFSIAINALEKQEKIKEAFEIWKDETGGYYCADDETISLIRTLKKILRSDEE